MSNVENSAEWERPTTEGGKQLNRQTARCTPRGCNCEYAYGTGRFRVRIPPQPFPDWLSSLMKVIMPQCGLPEQCQWPDCCNRNYYSTRSDAAGSHSDSEWMFYAEESPMTVISFSLIGTREFQLQEKRFGGGLTGDGTVDADRAQTCDQALAEGIALKTPARMPAAQPSTPCRTGGATGWSFL